jgi:hypothetical protein
MNDARTAVDKNELARYAGRTGMGLLTKTTPTGSRLAYQSYDDYARDIRMLMDHLGTNTPVGQAVHEYTPAFNKLRYMINSDPAASSLRYTIPASSNVSEEQITPSLPPTRKSVSDNISRILNQ